MAGATAAPYMVIDVRPEWLLDPDAVENETMGSKPKFWFRQSNAQGKWLFKYPIRRESGEHWAEKIGAEVAGLLGVPRARVELATFEDMPAEFVARVGHKGCVSESFTEEGVDGLVHGNEILHRIMPDYDTKAVRFRQPHHTLHNIWLALGEAFENPVESAAAKAQFAGYLTLDALIGNTDRHHENWGLLVRYDGNDLRIRLAHTYDHASCLGHELQDRRRELLLSEGRVGRYAVGAGRRGSGGIYWSSDDNAAPSPLNLVRLAAETEAYSEFLESSSARIRDLDENSLRDIVDRVPVNWMSDAAREFAIALMRFNLSQLREILK